MQTTAAESASDGPPAIDAQDMTAEWLSAALAQTGIRAKIASFTAQPVGHGQVGDTYRFSLTYEGTPSPDAPAVLIGKFHSANADSREAAREGRHYEHEYMFYKTLAPTARLSTPKMYYAQNDEDDRLVLLLEDLHPARQIDQMEGLTPAHARLAIAEVAKLHASHWGDGALQNNGWLRGGDAAQSLVTEAQMLWAWAGFKGRYQELLEPSHLRVVETYVKYFAHWNRPRPRPRSLAHNDFRADNFMFGTPEGGKPITVLDWQTLSFNFGAVDIAYLLGNSFSGDERAAVEAELLPLYYETLRNEGVREYAYTDFLEDYTHFTFAGLNIAIFASMVVRRTERGDRLFVNMFEHHCSHVLDRDALVALR